MGVSEGDPEGIGRYAALVAGLKERGWIDGDTAKFETYWAGGSVARIREIVPGAGRLRPGYHRQQRYGGDRRTAQGDPNDTRRLQSHR